MRAKTPILGLVSVISILIMLAGCKVAELKKPEVSVIGSRFVSVSLAQGRLDNKLRITNPNVFKLPVKAIHYTLLLNDREFVSGQTDRSLNVAAGGTQQVQLPLMIQYEKLLKGLGSVFQNKTIRFQLRGEIDFGLVRVPFSKTGDFSI
ncbi:MAG: LEA type 2 family protein [Thioalkalispiraceae bacterium]|jgi:LEA14-like dessication related protein